MSNYLDYSDVLSYDKKLNIIVTLRGWGKTYGFKSLSIKQFVKSGIQSVYCKRYRDDFEDIGQYFNGVKEEFPDYDFKVEKMKGWICTDPQDNPDDNIWQIMTFFLPLSRWQKIKGAEYRHVGLFCYDEFIKEDDTSRYLPNEPRALLNMLHTIFRNRHEGRIFLLGNLSTVLNPIFLYWKIHIPKGAKIVRGPEYLVYLKSSAAFIEESKDTLIGKLIQGTDYEDFAVNNNPYMDSDAYVIDNIKKGAENTCLIKIEGVVYGVWKTDIGYTLSRRHNPNHKVKLTIDLDEKDPGYMFVKDYKQTKQTMLMAMSFKQSTLFVDSMKIRDGFIKMLYDMKMYNM